jgi:hypothetical protein
LANRLVQGPRIDVDAPHRAAFAEEARRDGELDALGGPSDDGRRMGIHNSGSNNVDDGFAREGNVLECRW